MGKRLSSKLVRKILSVLLITVIMSNGAMPIAKAGKCERVARDCIEPGETRMIGGHSIYRDCWRYNDAYKCTGYAANNCAAFDDESYCQLAESSCKEKVGNWCVAQNRTYKCEGEEKYIKKEKRYRAPSIKRENIEEKKRVECGEAIRCIDGKCFDSSYQANNEMGEAVGMLATIAKMQGNDDKDVSVFKGEHRKCARKAFGLNPCCNPGGKAFIEKLGLSTCKPGEKELAQLVKDDKCHLVGTYRKKMLGVIGGWKKYYSYCCYESKIAKEINRQTREQRQLGKSWGDPESPNCTGFEIEELKRVDFEKLDFGFLGEDIQKGSLWSKMGDMSKAMEHTQNILEGEMANIKTDILNNGGNGKGGDDADIDDMNIGDMNEEIDDKKLFEKKFDEVHDDLPTQKKPDGRDKTRDIDDQKEQNYNEEIYHNRDKKGL